MTALTVQNPSSSIWLPSYVSALTNLNALALWFERKRQRIHLSNLDQRLLEDIGVSSDGANEKARRWD